MSHATTNKTSLSYDAVVIGAGPAGAVASRGLAQRGHSVLLVDKRQGDRRKVCGCCVNPNALAALKAVGFEEVCEKLGAVPLKHVKVFAAGRCATLRLPGGVSVSRSALDKALIEAAIGVGVVFQEGIGAKLAKTVADQQAEHRVQLANGSEIRCKAVVIADGIGGTSLADHSEYVSISKPATRVGAGAVVEAHAAKSLMAKVGKGEITMACGADGYLGAVRLECGGVDLAAAVDRMSIKREGGINNLMRRLSHESGAQFDWPDKLNWSVTPGLTRSRRRVAGPGLFIVGDAAGYVEPFTGEGIAWALAGGAGVVELASQAIHQRKPAQASAWEERYAQIVGHRQRSCRAIAWLLRRPQLTSHAVRFMSLMPWSGAAVAQRLARPTPIHTVTTPGTTEKLAT